MSKHKVSTSLQSLLSSRDIEVIAKIGAGATKAVFKGRMKAAGGVWLDVAIKIIDRKFLLSEEAKKAFLSEANVLMQVDHPNVEKLYDAFMTENNVVLITEFIKGISLENYMDRFYKQRPGEFIPWQVALIIVKKAADGLSAIHRAGFTHRDLSPNNILLSKESSFEEGVKIIDLGLAKPLQHGKPSLSSIFEVKGTPPFSAPELTVDASKTEERADSFSLASILYYLLTFNYPFGTLEDYYEKVKRQAIIPLQSFRSDIPQRVLEEVNSLLSDNLSASPQDRNFPYEISRRLENVLSSYMTNIFPVYKDAVLSYIFIPEVTDRVMEEDDDTLSGPAGTIKEEVSPSLKKKKLLRSSKGKTKSKSTSLKRIAAITVLVALMAAAVFFLGERKTNNTHKPAAFNPLVVPKKADIPTEEKTSPKEKVPPASVPEQPQKTKPPMRKEKTVPSPASGPEKAPQSKSLFGPGVKKLVLRSGTIETVLSPEGKILSNRVFLSEKKFIFFIKKK